MKKESFVFEEMGYLESDEVTGSLNIDKVKVNKHPANGAPYYKWKVSYGSEYNEPGEELLTLTMLDEDEYKLKVNEKTITLTLGQLDAFRVLLELMHKTEGYEREGKKVGFFCSGRLLQQISKVK